MLNLKSKNFTVTHIDTLVFGRCFTIYYHLNLTINDGLKLITKRKFDLEMFMHSKGEEAWLATGDGRSPSEDELPVEVLKTRFLNVIKH